MVVRGIIRERSGGLCEVQVACEGIAAVQQHHRRTRGMGSTKRPESNLPANGLHICVPCHVHIGAHPSQAYGAGWLVRQSSEPALVPVLYRGNWVKLDDLGNLTAVAA